MSYLHVYWWAGISFNRGFFWYQLSPSQVLFMLRRISVIDIMKVWVHPECMGWIYFTAWQELRCWNLENNCWWSVVTFFFWFLCRKLVYNMFWRFHLIFCQLIWRIRNNRRFSYCREVDNEIWKLTVEAELTSQSRSQSLVSKDLFKLLWLW